MIASQVGFRLGLGLASPRRKGTRRRHCLRLSPHDWKFRCQSRLRKSMLCLLFSSVAFTLPNPKPNNSPQPVRKPAASTARSSSAVEGGQHCLVDEPVVECFVRSEVVDGPWADQWARYVLLRPGMSYRELKVATLRRNQLDPSLRIPGTYRTLRSSNHGKILTLTSNPNPLALTP